MNDRTVMILPEVEGTDSLGAATSTAAGSGTTDLADVQFPEGADRKENGARTERYAVKVFFDHPVSVRAGTRIGYTHPITGEAWVILVESFVDMGGRGERFMAKGTATRPAAPE